MKKALIAMLAALLALTCLTPATLAENDYTAEGWYEVFSIVPENYDFSYIYDQPSSTYGTNLGKARDGSEVYVFYTTHGTGRRNSIWAYCDYDGTVGYIRYENLIRETYSRYPYYDYDEDEDLDDGEDWYDYCYYVSPEDAFEYLSETFGYLGTQSVINCKYWVSLREQPDSTSPRLAKVPLGAKVEAFMYDDCWTLCRYGGSYGFIQSDYLY